MKTTRYQAGEKPRALPPKTCHECGKSFKPIHRQQVMYCGDKCRRIVATRQANARRERRREREAEEEVPEVVEKHCRTCASMMGGKPAGGFWRCRQAFERMEGKNYCLQWREKA